MLWYLGLGLPEYRKWVNDKETPRLRLRQRKYGYGNFSRSSFMAFDGCGRIVENYLKNVALFQWTYHCCRCAIGDEYFSCQVKFFTVLKLELKCGGEERWYSKGTVPLLRLVLASTALGTHAAFKVLKIWIYHCRLSSHHKSLVEIPSNLWTPL